MHGRIYAERYELFAPQVKVGASAREIVLTSECPDDRNSFEQPKWVAPRENTIEIAGPKFTYTLPKHSFVVLRLKEAK